MWGFSLFYKPFTGAGPVQSVCPTLSLHWVSLCQPGQTGGTYCPSLVHTPHTIVRTTHHAIPGETPKFLIFTASIPCLTLQDLNLMEYNFLLCKVMVRAV